MRASSSLGKIELLFGFYTFGYNLKTQLSPNGNRAFKYCNGTFVRTGAAKERPVQFDPIKREGLKEGERSVACPEIIKRNTKSDRAQ